MTLEEVKRWYVGKILEEAGGNKSEVIPHRPPGRELTPATVLAGYPGGSAIGAVSGGCGIASLGD
jgi:hypothetical protein